MTLSRHLALRFAACLVLASFVGGRVRADSYPEWTLGDDFSTAKGGYRSNTFSASVATSESFSADLGIGATRSTTPETDTTGSASLGLTFNFGPEAWLELAGSHDTGVKAPLVSVTLFETVGTATKRAADNAFTPTFGWKLVDVRGDEDTVRKSVETDLSLILGSNKVPIFSQGPAGQVQIATYTVGDRGVTAGLTGRLGDTTAGASYQTHRYTETFALTPQAQRKVDSLPSRVRTFIMSQVGSFGSSVGQGAVSGVPRNVSNFSLTQRLSRLFSVHASYEYEEVTLTDAGLARTVSGELRWDPSDSWEIRGGAYWTRQDGATTPYTTGGVSFYF